MCPDLEWITINAALKAEPIKGWFTLSELFNQIWIIQQHIFQPVTSSFLPSSFWKRRNQTCWIWETHKHKPDTNTHTHPRHMHTHTHIPDTHTGHTQTHTQTSISNSQRLGLKSSTWTILRKGLSLSCSEYFLRVYKEVVSVWDMVCVGMELTFLCVKRLESGFGWNNGLFSTSDQRQKAHRAAQNTGGQPSLLKGITTSLWCQSSVCSSFSLSFFQSQIEIKGEELKDLWVCCWKHGSSPCAFWGGRN